MRNLKQTFGMALVASLLALAVVLGAAPVLAQTCTPITSGEVARWTGDGNALDSIGSNHGTLQNGTTFGPALFGQGFLVDGVNDDFSGPQLPLWRGDEILSGEEGSGPTGRQNGARG